MTTHQMKDQWETNRKKERRFIFSSYYIFSLCNFGFHDNDTNKRISIYGHLLYFVITSSYVQLLEKWFPLQGERAHSLKKMCS